MPGSLRHGFKMTAWIWSSAQLRDFLYMDFDETHLCDLRRRAGVCRFTGAGSVVHTARSWASRTPHTAVLFWHRPALWAIWLASRAVIQLDCILIRKGDKYHECISLSVFVKTLTPILTQMLTDSGPHSLCECMSLCDWVFFTQTQTVCTGTEWHTAVLENVNADI